MNARKPTDANEQRPEPPATPEASAAAVPEAPVESEAETLRREAAELRDKNLRLLAESRNQRQRAEREKADAIKYAEGDFARDLLVVLDDLERTQEAAGAAKDAQSVGDGVRIIYEHFLKVMQTHGIAPIEALGQTFDPHVHEALLQQPSDECPAGHVLKEVGRGYKMHDRVLRPSRVIVSSGPAAAAGGQGDAAKE